MGFFEKQKECNSKKRIVLLHSGECNSIFRLHSWEIELSIQHHVTKINQLHDLNLTRYYKNSDIYARIYIRCEKPFHDLFLTNVNQSESQNDFFTRAKTVSSNQR